GQIAVEEGSNEITAVPKLLELLELSGAVVTLDAMHCQTNTAQKIREKEADYILTVKGNQPTLQKTIQELFEGFRKEKVRNKKVPVHQKTKCAC
ncbi:Transposase, partial [hydrothermal vent metagenome]